MSEPILKVENLSASYGLSLIHISFGNKAMTAAVMGGFGSLPGAMLGSIILGVVESMCNLYISTAYKDVFSFIILVVVLFCRPQGILGKKLSLIHIWCSRAAPRAG